MNAAPAILNGASFPDQPQSPEGVSAEERDSLVISAIQIDGVWVIKSRYGDDVWELTGGPTNLPNTRRQIEFGKVPPAFREVAKEVLYRYMRRGREGFGRPKTATIVHTFAGLLPFFRYLSRLGIKDLSNATPIICVNYVATCKAQLSRRSQRPLSPNTLQDYFAAVELLYELSHYASMQMPAHPWPESSAKHLAGRTGRVQRSSNRLMPDDVFCALFQAAWKVVQGGHALLNLRDDLEGSLQNSPKKSAVATANAKRRFLKDFGWTLGLRSFTMALTELSTACYIVIASLSGCRNHELAYLRAGACYSSVGESGETYWWMRSQSDKTGLGKREWMIPEAAVEAIHVMERWAVPLQTKLALDIDRQREANPIDPEIADAQEHLDALFLTVVRRPSDRVRTQSNPGLNAALKTFAATHGIDWEPASHQFRCKFANYAARSRFGDLRYLREHFKHWSQDITNDSYALNGNAEMDLYAEIQDELDSLKDGLVEKWLKPGELLAGGYGANLMAWRNREESIALFRDHASMVRSVAQSHAIRSNGHAWCTADDNRCIGNTFEKTRCGGCDNAVIDSTHTHIYRGLYDDIKVIAECDDIGSGGRARMLRDLARCREILISLGHDPEGLNA